MKNFKTLFMAMCAVFMTGTVFTSCSDDDDPIVPIVLPTISTTDAISGTYVGTLNAVGLPSDEAETAYVVLTKKSSNSVSCTIESEGWGVNMQPVNLTVTNNNGIINLESETSKAISGQIINNNLQLTYQTASSYVFQFLGKKD